MPAIVAIGAGIAAGAGAAAIGATTAVAVMAGVGTAIATGVMTSQQEKQAKKQASIQRGYLDEEAKAMLTAKEQAEIQTEINKELAEKKMLLETQRSQVETLANLLNTKKTVEQTGQVFITPSVPKQPITIIDRFNQWIDNLLRYR